MGGTDDPTNLIDLTIPEHAEAHRILWETYGKIEDKWAWCGLAGLTDEAESARRELLASPEVRARISASQKRRFANMDPAKNQERIEKLKRHYDDPANRQRAGAANRGRKFTDAHREKLRQICLGRPQTDLQKSRARAANECQWRVTLPTGETMVITNLRQFCLHHKLSQGNLSTHGHTKGFKATRLT